MVAGRATGQNKLLRWMRRHGTKRLIQYTILIAWSVLVLFPVYWTFASSLKTPQEIFQIPPKWVFTPTLHNYEVVWGLKVGTELEGVTKEQEGAGESPFPSYLVNTLIVATGSCVLSLVLGCGAAYALARGQVRWRRAILTGTLVTRLIPPVVVLVPIYVLWRNYHLLGKHIGLILAYLTFNLPFTIWMMSGFFQELPIDLEEAALVDGCSRIQALIKIVLPLVSPGLAATAVFLIMNSWNEFLYASVLTGTATKTLSPSILGYITDKAILWGRLYAAGSTILVPVLIFTFMVQRYMGIGLTGGAVKG